MFHGSWKARINAAEERRKMEAEGQLLGEAKEENRRVEGEMKMMREEKRKMAVEMMAKNFRPQEEVRGRHRHQHANTNGDGDV